MVEPKKKTTPKAKIAMLVRQLSAHERGVRAATWCAIERTLQSHDMTWVDVGNWIEHGGNGELDEAEAQALFDAGVKEGEQREHKKAAANSNYGTSALPSAFIMASFCHERRERLARDKDREFVDHMIIVAHRRTLSPKQQTWLEDLYLKLGGRI